MQAGKVKKLLKIKFLARTILMSILAAADELSSRLPLTMLPTGSRKSNRGRSVSTKMRRCLDPAWSLLVVVLEGGSTSCLNTWPLASTYSDDTCVI